MSSKVEQSRRYKRYSNHLQNVSEFGLKNWQFLVKLGSKLAKIRLFFLQFLTPHFSREMSRKTISRSREKCAGLLSLYYISYHSDLMYSKKSIVEQTGSFEEFLFIFIDRDRKNSENSWKCGLVR